MNTRNRSEYVANEALAGMTFKPYSMNAQAPARKAQPGALVDLYMALACVAALAALFAFIA